LLLKYNWLFAKGTRLFVRGNGGEEKLVLHRDREVILEQRGTIDPAGKVLPEIVSTDPTAVKVVKATKFDKLGKQLVTIKAVGAGRAELKGHDPKDPPGTFAAGLAPLTVVAGEFENHTDMKVDLLADVCRGSDPGRIHAVHRLLNDNSDNIFNENWDHNINQFGPRACGTVSKVGGAVLWGGDAEPKDFKTYHVALSRYAEVTSRAQVKYNKETVLKAAAAIQGWLERKKVPVVVGIFFGPPSKANYYGQLERTGLNGHSVLIVGCNKAGTRFLYVDPWYGGSNLQYRGGVRGVSGGGFDQVCPDLGVIQIDYWEGGRGPLLRTSSEVTGTFRDVDDSFLEVISGP
jgi:hypothetical protein